IIMKKFLLFSFVILTVMAIWLLSNNDNTIVDQSHLIESPSSIGTRENPQQRMEYELAMIANPETGMPEPDHRRKELLFFRKMKSKTLASRAESETETESWKSIGPVNVGGRTRGFQLDVLNPRHMIAGGVSGGVWETEDLGQSWTRTSDLTKSIDVTALEQDVRPGKENIWYYGTGELRGNTARSGPARLRGDGIYKSTDNGKSWNQLASTAFGISSLFNSQFQYIWNIRINPTLTDVDEVIVAAFGGILRSTDGGESWQVVLGKSLINPEIDLNSVVAPFYTEINITNDGDYFATMSSFSTTGNYDSAGIYFSEDAVNWQSITPPGFPQQTERTVIATHAGAKIAYFLTTIDDVEFLWKLEYGNNTFNWTNLSDNVPDFDVELGEFDSQSSFNLLAAIDPENPDIVYLGGTNLYRSSDGYATSANTRWIGGYTPEGGAGVYENHHPDQHVLRFLPQNSNVLLSVNDGGIHLTQGANAENVEWQELNTGYITSQFYTIAMQKDQASDFIIGGMQDNGTYIRPNTPVFTWNRFFGGDGSFCYITKGRRFWYFSFQSSRIFRVSLQESDLSVLRFARVDPVGGGDGFIDYLFVNPFEIDPDQESVMYLAGGDRIWRNDNLEQVPTGSNDPTSVNWNQLENTITAQQVGGSFVRNDGQVTSLALAKQESGDKLFYGTSFGKLFRVEDPGINSSQVSDLTSDAFPRGGYIADISINEENPTEIIVIFSNHEVRSLFRSTDNGSTFDHIGGNLEENPDGSGSGPSIRWAEIVPLEDGTYKYFVGTSMGLFSAKNLDGDDTIWEQEGSEVLGNSVIRSMAYRPLDGKLLVATHGNGVFETNIPNQKIPEEFAGEFDFALLNIYPNPLTETSSSSRIDFTIPETGTVKIDVFQATGQLVTTLIWSELAKGRNQVFWDGTNSTGSPVPNGTYFFRLRYSTERLGGRLIINR
ncbi:MAG: FlgD immunoglobulin-like domain containing protein, partial [Cyclobacteriaceae bacterium]